MVKKNKKENTTSFLEFPKSVYNFEVFNQKLSIKNLLIYNLLLILLISVLNLVKESMNLSNFGLLEAFVYSFIGIILISLVFYTIFYIFICAFEKRNKSAIESYLVFVAISLPFLLIGHLLNWINALIVNQAITLVFGFAILLLVIYYVYNFIRHFRSYFKISTFKILASLILVDMLLILLGVLQYLSFLLLNQY